jgi:hypothetical protein
MQSSERRLSPMELVQDLKSELSWLAADKESTDRLIQIIVKLEQALTPRSAQNLQATVE